MIDISKYPCFLRDPKLVKRINFLEVEWRRAYPEVDLESQIGWANAWLISSGKKYQDMSRFLNNWFKRCAQDLQKARANPGPIQLPAAKKYVETKPEGEVMSAEDWRKIKEAL